MHDMSTIEIHKHGYEEMSLIAKAFAAQAPEDLNSNPKALHKKTGLTAHDCNLNTVWVQRQEDCWDFLKTPIQGNKTDSDKAGL